MPAFIFQLSKDKRSGPFHLSQSSPMWSRNTVLKTVIEMARQATTILLTLVLCLNLLLWVHASSLRAAFKPPFPKIWSPEQACEVGLAHEIKLVLVYQGKELHDLAQLQSREGSCVGQYLPFISDDSDRLYLHKSIASWIGFRRHENGLPLPQYRKNHWKYPVFNWPLTTCYPL